MHQMLDMRGRLSTRGDSSALLRQPLNVAKAAGVPLTVGATLRAIAEDVAVAMDVTLPELYGARRHKSLVIARHCAIWLASRCTPYTVSVIARHFLQDRSSAEHAIERIAGMRAADDRLARILLSIQARHEMAV